MSIGAEARSAGWVTDHVFMFVTPDDPEIRRLEGLGLVESFRRRHPGQGTANVCFCSDNAYLELLWIVDAAEAGSSALARCDLIARADWRRSGVSPFGIALRNSAADASLPFPSWDYCAPFLPAGTSVPVAIASDDPRQPLLFHSPGNRRPDQWTDAPAGLRQRQAGLADLLSVRLDFPTPIRPAAAFQALEQAGVLTLGSDVAPLMELELSAIGGGRRRVRVPQD